jgi:hypothetical protein
MRHRSLHRSPAAVGRHIAISQNSQNICGTDSPHRWRRLCLSIDDQLPDVPQHSPCCLVGDAGFALNSFRGNPALCRGHPVDHVKPSLQRSRASRKYSPLQRVDVISAIIAGVGCATGHARVLALNVALLAPGDTVRPARLFYLFQAGILIWKFAFKIGSRIPQVWRIGLPARILQVTLGHRTRCFTCLHIEIAFPRQLENAEADLHSGNFSFEDSPVVSTPIFMTPESVN